MGTARDGPAGPAGFKDNCPASTVRVKGSGNTRLYEHEEVLRPPEPPHDITSERFYWMQMGTYSELDVGHQASVSTQ